MIWNRVHYTKSLLAVLLAVKYLFSTKNLSAILRAIKFFSAVMHISESVFLMPSDAETAAQAAAKKRLE